MLDIDRFKRFNDSFGHGAAQKRDMGAVSITVSVGAAICSFAENANMEC